MKVKKFAALIIATAAISIGLAFMCMPTVVFTEDKMESEISAKLDQVLAGQKTVIDELAALKQEVTLLKIRVTQNQ